MPILETIAANTANSAIGAGMGLLLGRHNDQRQLKQQQKLTDLQLEADKKLTTFQREQQYQMWKDTNFSAQKEELIKAGLNPGLLYGMSGGGGTTTGAGAAHSSAPHAQGSTNEIMGMMQLRSQEAQIEMMKAQADKARADAEKTRGVDTTETMTKIELNTLQKIISEYTGKEMKDQYDFVKSPWRDTEQRAYGETLGAQQALGDTIHQLWLEGKLKDKSEAEIESILLSNAKSRVEKRNIEKTFDLLEGQINGVKLDNALKEFAKEMQEQTGVAPSANGFLKLIGWIMKSLLSK